MRELRDSWWSSVRRLGVASILLAPGLGCEASDAEVGSPAGMELDDEFEDGELGAWDVLNPDTADVRVENGALVLEPAARSLWFNRDAAVLVHQQIEGDFSMTAQVTARRLSDPSLPPEPRFRLGGLMARDPSSEGENYVFIVVGADGDDVSVETKSTTDSQSVFDGPAWPSGAGELRLCRVGDEILALIRDSSSGTWATQETFVRPDLPGVLQVGPMGYANQAEADLSVRFDYVRFAEVTSTQDCAL